MDENGNLTVDEQDGASSQNSLIETHLNREVDRLRYYSRGWSPIIYFSEHTGLFTNTNPSSNNGDDDFHMSNCVDWVVKDTLIVGFDECEESGVISFKIMVETKHGEFWNVWRRYSMFHEV